MLYDNWKHIEFAWPAFLLTGLLIPLLIVWYRRQYLRRQPGMTVSTTWFFSVSSWRNHIVHAPFVLRLLSIGFLTVTLARPQLRQQMQRTEGEGIDIVLCMDVSGSMGSRDIPPSRLEVAKSVAMEFVSNRPVDRIGLVIFSGESFTQCPLTTDKGALLTQIQNLESRRYLRDGTVIGEGLATAVDRLEASKAKSKVVILLTDGKEDPPETRLLDPLTALEIARTQGVKVYTIGMSAQTTPPVQGVRTAGVDYVDEALLRQIATQTGGLYFRAATKEALQQVYDQIDQLEKSKVERVSFQRREEKFGEFLLLALFFLLAEMILRLTVLRKYP